MSGFQFKQFYVAQDQCAMKVGTDGVLLGAWADIFEKKQIVDLGTGTGLIALMLAQRSEKISKINAVEKDPNAFHQATENCQQSPWANKIQCYHQDIFDFCTNTTEKFDLIVANPPYFSIGVKCISQQRELARYMQQNHFAWLMAAANCLAAQGKIQFVLPYEAGKNLIQQTALYTEPQALFCTEYCEVITKKGKTTQRLLLSFEFTQKTLKQTQLVIYDENNQYTDEFKQLTQDFYLKF
ncbi:methyltransferase [[Haemophilus] felis]|nr:methyltransferase [[Haemophilus] felis]